MKSLNSWPQLPCPRLHELSALVRNNPYLSKVKEFPGRLFSDPLNEEEIADLKVKLVSANSLIVELGSGSGNHLIELARSLPDATCVGLELRYKRAHRTIEKSNRFGLSNIYVLRGDGRRFLREFIQPHTVAQFYVNFPDPWPKQRERGNRVLSPEFLREIAGWITRDGFLYFRTDQEDYFDSVVEIIQNQEVGLKILELTKDLCAGPLSRVSLPTEFQELFLRQKTKINALIAKI